MKRALKIAVVLVLAFMVAYGVNYLIFGDTAVFTPQQIVSWTIISAVVIYLFREKGSAGRQNG